MYQIHLLHRIRKHRSDCRICTTTTILSPSPSRFESLRKGFSFQHKLQDMLSTNYWFDFFFPGTLGFGCCRGADLTASRNNLLLILRRLLTPSLLSFTRFPSRFRHTVLDFPFASFASSLVVCFVVSLVSLLHRVAAGLRRVNSLLLLALV